MQGIEVVNGPEYFPEAHRWCLEKKLTMLGNTDVHEPLAFKDGKHRTMTLVFATERTQECYKRCVDKQKNSGLSGRQTNCEERYLNALFHGSIEILKTEKHQPNTT